MAHFRSKMGLSWFGCGSQLRASRLLALSSGQHQDFDPSCEQYFYEGIDWGDLRQTFEIYADKYLDRPQLLAKEVALAQRYAFSYHPENRCQLGDLSLRFFLWLSVDPADLADIARAKGRRGDILSEVMQETLDWFWDLNVSWAAGAPEVHESGWPLFSFGMIFFAAEHCENHSPSREKSPLYGDIYCWRAPGLRGLACWDLKLRLVIEVSEKLRDDGQEICTTEGQLAPFIDSFDNAIMVGGSVSAERCAALLLEAPHCPDAVASALLALADVMRTTAWQQKNRYYQFTSEMPRSQPPERDAERLLQRAEATVRSQSARWSWLTTRWPVWRLLDRLGAAEAVNVSSGGSWFWMYVFPHRPGL
ncbi:unnamed protein product [Symbiodinium sp. CCMP2456]|nr:unnamed protein product [Symbiodinium sp. CCMP2456]